MTAGAGGGEGRSKIIDKVVWTSYADRRLVAPKGHHLRSYYVYMLASRKHGTLYIGVTNNLIRRVAEHRRGETPGFTKMYHVTNLVWFDVTDDVRVAIWREKCMKAWKRKWKIELIESMNPEWRDLWDDIKNG